METVQFAILVGISGCSLALGVYLLIKIRAVSYLLEQPVVKKMSPQLKLKPIKIDDSEPSAPRHDSRPAPASNGNPNRDRSPGSRPNFERPEGGERQNRDSQPRHDRGPRPDRPEGGDRGNTGDRGPRNDRFSGRDRAPRNERNDRHGGPSRDASGGRDGGPNGGDRNRNRSETNTNGNDTTHAPTNESAPLTSRPAPIPTPENHGTPVFAPRRPLPSTVDQDGSAKEFTPPEPVSAADAADALFMRDDSDIQHGRRTQMKKKPKFDVSEEDVKTGATEESKA